MALAVLAAGAALKDAALRGPLRAGVLIGSSRGGLLELEAQRPGGYLMASTTVGMAAAYVAKKFQLQGHALGLSSACASGLQAVGEALRLLREAREQVVLAGGAEAPLCRLALQGYGRMGALSRGSTARASRPFDRRRDGFVLSEGAVVLVLEALEHALRRGARIYGELLGYGNTIDAHHETRPLARTEAACIGQALRDARLGPQDVQLLLAHAPGTPLGDATEAEALLLALGQRATEVPTLTLKALTGHMLSASGVMEVAVALKAMAEGLLPPNPHTTEPEGPLKLLLGRRPLRYGAHLALVNSFGFGGFNAAVLLRGPQGI